MFSDLPTAILYLTSIWRPVLSRWGQYWSSKSEGNHGQEPQVLKSSYSSAAVLKRAGPCFSFIYMYRRKQALVVPNNRALKYMKRKLMGLKGLTDNSKTVVETPIPHFQ